MTVVAEPTGADGLDEAGKELKALMEELLGREIRERIAAAESRSDGAVKELQRAQQTQHVQLKKEVQNQGALLANLEESLQSSVNAAVREVSAAMAARATALSQEVAAAAEGTETRVLPRLDGVTAALARQSEGEAVLLERVSLLERRQFWLMLALVTSTVILIGLLGLVLVRVAA